MMVEGQVVLFRFPQSEQEEGKPRPALLLRRIPGAYGDWLLCMISTQLRQAVPEFDEIVDEGAPDFTASGLKSASVIRVGRLAVVDPRILLGSIGQIAPERMERILGRLSAWLRPKP